MVRVGMGVMLRKGYSNFPKIKDKGITIRCFGHGFKYCYLTEIILFDINNLFAHI